MNTRNTFLTDEQRRHFEDEGYLVVPNALTPQRIEAVLQAIDRCTKDRPDQAHNQAAILAKDPAFLDLVDLPTVFPKIWRLLGSWNIWVNHTHYNVNPPDASAEGFVYGWHRDGGAMHVDLPGAAPLVSIKVGFYLTDLTRDDSGYTYIIPGTHRADPTDARANAILAREGPFPVTALPDDAVPERVAAGSAVLYHNRTIHSIRSPNLTGVTRKVVFIQYAFRWMQPVDAMNVESLDKSVADPIRRQLLGLTSSKGFTHSYAQGRSGRFYPNDDEVPLRKYLIEELGENLRGAVWQ